MRWSRPAVIFSLGFFSLVAQTLLFRDFLTAFEGNELGVGSFFGSWLLWVALGALAGRWQPARCAAPRGPFEIWTLLYLPAFWLQQYLTLRARLLGGISPYQLYPFDRMFVISLLVNAPISLTTGFLFTRACRWAAEHRQPVARVYVGETLGSFAGGVVVTILLAAGLPGKSVILLAGGVLAAASGLSLLAPPRSARSAMLGGLPLALAAASGLAIAGGAGSHWARREDQAAWRRLLPGEDYQGSFATAQAKYLYGRREGQFLVVSWGGVSEMLPDLEHASEVVALSLAQRPAARNILVVGPGSLAIAARFRHIAQVRKVVWLHPDPQYPQRLLAALPPSLRAAASGVEVPGADMRAFLRRARGKFDLAILNLPEATTLVLNRYWTREFFLLVKEALAEGGAVCTRLSGAANFLGGELAYLGASALQTVESVFGPVVLKPGDESWLIASSGGPLVAEPAALRDRFAGIAGAAAIYPPDGLLSLYLPDRAEFQMGKYRETLSAAGPASLLNTDGRPKALLFSMLLALRRAEFVSIAEHVPTLLAAGPWIACCPIVLYGLLRGVYLWAPRRGRKAASAPGAAVFDSQFLIFSTGLAGMALSVVLMFLYQACYGSLFLHIGMISSLFMLGSCAGGMFSMRLLERVWRPRGFLAAVLLAHACVVAAMVLTPAHAPQGLFAGLFAACGFFVGVYFPIAAERLSAAGRSPEASGAALELLDHLGGAAGAVMTSWGLLPLLGGRAALAVLGLLVAVNLVPALVPARVPRMPRPADRFDRLARPLGYTLLGAGALALASSQIAWGFRDVAEEQLLLAAAKEMAGGAELSEQRVRRGDGTEVKYWRASDGCFIFSTGPFSQGIDGYGGPMLLAARVEQDGTLRDLRILRSQETPAYVESVKRGWLARLPGRSLFEPSAFEGVDAMSGATMTSEAILHTLERAGQGFAAAVLGRQAEPATAASAPWRPDREFLGLAVLTALALAVRRRPGRWRRRWLLLASLLLAGLALNLQYSTQHVMALLGLSLPGKWLGGPFFLIVLVPTCALVFGNVYCGYLCPFGALQELISELRPARLAVAPDKRAWRYGRAFKYGLLLLLVILFAITRRYEVLAADPLITVFSSVWNARTLVLAGIVLGLSLVFRRFWCRNLCPAGAFLSLVGGLRLLRRWGPPPAPARCDLGVRAAGELDCMCCDRCWHEEV